MIRSKKTRMFLALVSVLCWTALPAFAGHDWTGTKHGHGKSHGTSDTWSGGGHHHGKSSAHQGDSDNPHSNKGGALRGLDRANQAAGSHGEEGRENAASHHGGHSSGGDSDRE